MCAAQPFFHLTLLPRPIPYRRERVWQNSFLSIRAYIISCSYYLPHPVITRLLLLLYMRKRNNKICLWKKWIFEEEFNIIFYYWVRGFMSLSHKFPSYWNFTLLWETFHSSRWFSKKIIKFRYVLMKMITFTLDGKCNSWGKLPVPLSNVYFHSRPPAMRSPSVVISTRWFNFHFATWNHDPTMSRKVSKVARIKMYN